MLSEVSLMLDTEGVHPYLFEPEWSSSQSDEETLWLCLLQYAVWSINYYMQQISQNITDDLTRARRARS